MTTLPRLALVSALVASAGHAGAAPAREGATAALEAIRAKHDLPALAVVVVKDGRVADRAATGVRKLGDPTPVTTNDLWHIGSCTKSMTATLAAMLVEEGKIQWGTTITEALPGLKGKIDRQFETVTLEQLLTHRGGFATAAPSGAWSRAWAQEGTAVAQRLEFIEAVMSKPPALAPGGKFTYSNQGYAVAGAMLEKLAGKPWETLLTEKLFRPLGMTTASFGVPGALGKVDQPWGHSRSPLKTSPVQKDNPPAIGPGGTVHCSLDDLARYAMLHLRRGADGPALLKPATFRRLHTPPPGGDYAFGWHSVARGWAKGKALTHNGSNTMWFLVMWLAPERDFAVIAATNIAGDKAEKGCDDVAAAMIGKWLK